MDGGSGEGREVERVFVEEGLSGGYGGGEEECRAQRPRSVRRRDGGAEGGEMLEEKRDGEIGVCVCCWREGAAAVHDDVVMSPRCRIAGGRE